MKVHLMSRDADFVPGKERNPLAETLERDLELNTLIDAMASGDAFVRDVARAALSVPLTEPAAIRYRQAVLADALADPAAMRALYDLSAEAIVLEKNSYFGFYTKYPSAMLSSARNLMEAFVGVLRRLRAFADTHAAQFASEGLSTFCAMIRRELTDAYFESLGAHLKVLRFKRGVLMSARIGAGDKGEQYVLRKLPERHVNPFQRWFDKPAPSYRFSIPERDEAGARALSELEARGIELVAQAVSQSAEHVLSFFNALRTELAFYIGCMNLHAALSAHGCPMCVPAAHDPAARRLAARELFEPCLVLRAAKPVVPNAFSADRCDLIVITGANEGGKSTFLRSVAIAQLLMQTGMCVPAARFDASVACALFTHYKREEDASMTSGKFDEELVRMDAIADALHAQAIVYFNESFASTNEREGGDVAMQIVDALLDRQVRVIFVTHMYELSHGLSARRPERSLFLRAQRVEGGTRTFRLVSGAPLETSYGEDLYARVFSDEIAGETSGDAGRQV